MGRQPACKVVSVFLALALAFTCNGAVVQPLAAFASEGHPDASSDANASAVGLPERASVSSSVGEESASEQEDAEGSNASPFASGTPATVQPEVFSSVPVASIAQSVGEPDGAESAPEPINETRPTSSFSVREARDVTDDVDQLALGVGRLRWQDAKGDYKDVVRGSDGAYRLPTPFEGVKALNLELSFKVLKDDDTRTISSGDCFTFALDQVASDGLTRYFTISDIASPQDIIFGGVPVATYVLVGNKLKVTFDDNVSFESGYTNIQGGVSLSFGLNDAAFGSDDETGIDLVLQDISNPVHLVVPPKTSTVDGIEKKGVYDPGQRTVTWTIEAGAKTPGLDLAGMRIVDTYDAAALDFVSASTVSADGKTATAITPDVGTPGTCAYTFPAGSIAPQTLNIVTKVQDGALPTGADAVELRNSVELQRGSSPLVPGPAAQTSATASVAPMGIAKKGEQIDGDTVRWSITVNDKQDAWLWNAVVTDELASNLTYVGGTLKVDGGDVPVHANEPTVKPSSDYATLVNNTLKFYFLDTEKSSHGSSPIISKRHTLTFETKLEAAKVEDVSVFNTAKLDGNWPDGPGPGLSFNNSMGINADYDFAFLAKSGSIEGRSGVITWDVHPQTRTGAYDSAVLVDTIDASDQRFVEGSVTLSYDGDEHQQAELVQKGWLAVAGQGTEADPTTLRFSLSGSDFVDLNKVSIAYRTQATVGYLEGTHGIDHTYRNTAKLEVSVNSASFEKTADARVTYRNDVISKSAEYEYDDVAGSGFLRYTLIANANEMELVDAVVSDDLSQLASVYYLKDGGEIPVPSSAWVLDSGRTKVKGGPHGEPYVDEHGVLHIELGEGASRTINSIYTIDVYLTLSDEARQTYLLDSGSGFIRTQNTARIEAESAGGHVDREAPFVTTPTKGDVANELVDKSSLLNVDDGFIRWRIDANPQGAQLKNAVIKDVLNKSLQLDVASVTLYESEHAQDGLVDGSGLQSDAWSDPADNDWKRVGAVFSVEPGDDGSSVLNVHLPDEAKAYTLVYNTAIVEAVVAGEVQNRASLMNDGVEKGSGSHTQNVSEDAWGYLERTASYRFKKVDAVNGDKQPLGKGVSFGLFEDQACTKQLKTVTPNDEGVFGFYGLKPGDTYWFKELTAPEGYVLDTTVRELAVPADAKGMQKDVGTVVNKRVEAHADVVIEKRFETEPGDDALAREARFSLVLHPLGIEDAETVSVAFDGAAGAYRYAGVKPIDQAVELVTTKADAVGASTLALAGLPWGEYELRETSAQPGYIPLGSVKKFTVSRDGSVAFDADDFDMASGVPVLRNDKTRLSIDKTDLSDAPRRLAGAELKLTGTFSDGSGEKNWISSDSGARELVGELVAGETYVLQESAAPDGCLALPDGGISFKMGESGLVELLSSPTYDDGVPAAVLSDDGALLSVRNVTLPGSVTLSKVDDDTLDALDGVEFALFDGEGTLVQGGLTTGLAHEAPERAGDAWTSSPTDEGVLGIAGLSWGSYCLQETGALEGYELPDARHPFTIGPGERGTVLSVDLGTVANRQTELAFYKTALFAESCSDPVLGSDAPDSTRPLGGAEFAIYSDASCTNVVARATSEADGRVSCRGLSAGATYWVKESAAPVGHVLSDAVLIAAFDSNGKLESLVAQGGGDASVVVNDVNRVDIRLKKVSEIDPTKVLPGSQYGLYKRVASPLSRSDEPLKLVAKAVTDENGMLVFEGVLMDEEYVVRELVAPDGSLVSKHPISLRFSLDGDGIPKLVLFDDGSDTAEIGEDGLIVWKEPQVVIGFSKKDPEGDLLAGAQLRVVDEAGTAVADAWTSSSEKGHRIEGVLVAGKTYRLVELEAPEGYVKAADVTFAVGNPKLGPNEGYVQHVEMVNERVGKESVKPGGSDKPGDPAGSAGSDRPVEASGEVLPLTRVLARTGDVSFAVLVVGVALASAGIAVASGVRRRRRRS